MVTENLGRRAVPEFAGRATPARELPGLAGHPRWGYRSSMDAGLLWTVIGSAAGVLGAVLVAWQVRLQVADRREVRRPHGIDQQLSSHDAGGLPVAVPLGRLPAEIRGRDGLLAELRRPLARRPHPRRSGQTWVLAGMGGLGKSTMALAAAQNRAGPGLAGVVGYRDRYRLADRGDAGGPPPAERARDSHPACP